MMQPVRLILKVVIFSLIAFTQFSCAAIFMGSRQRISFYSDPPGAKVYLNGNDTKEVTPTTINVKRHKQDLVVKFERDGYNEEIQLLQRKYNFLAAVDYFCYIIPGVISQAMGAQNIYPNSAYATLKPLESSIPATSTLVTVTETKYAFKKISDIDIISASAKPDNNRFALIIGNEDYTSHQADLNSEANVVFARDDASAFGEYAVNVLGVPERNITLLLDATAAEMRQGLLKMNLIAKNSAGSAEFFVYYAGHGLPDENTKDPYLIPVDVSGKFLTLGISLKEFYQYLSEYPTKRTTVFLDACFSGGARNQGLIAARGVRLTPKNELIKGNLVVFTASDAQEQALPYFKKNHGLFTYHLLQKLKDTSGTISYGQLSEYLEKSVPLESVIINNKEQHPKTVVSPEVAEVWNSWTFN
jgi:hypothetical protein